MRSKPSQIDHHPSSHVKPQPSSIPAKSWMPRPPPQNNNGAHTTTTKATGDKITTHLSSSPSSTPKTGSFVAELSKRLEEQADAPPSPRRPLSSTGSPRTSVLRKTSNISHTTLPKRPSVTNFASHTSQSPHQHLATHITTAANAAATTASVPSSISAPPPPAAITQRSSSSSSTVSSTLHLPVIARTGTGNSTASTSSLSTTDSPSRRAWQYGAAITSWFTGSSADDHHSQQSLKDSITIVSKDPLPAEDRSPSGSDTATSFPASLPVSPQLSGKQELKRSKVVRELVETECAYQSDMIVIKEIYYDQAHSVLAPADIKILFSNLTTILEFERPFVNELKEAEVGLQDEMDQDTTTVGKVFRQNVSSSRLGIFP
ncbi:hypothetical protein BCR43DRAFT_371670 [Syncephalastrum racemosum]|uniref:DH domain-containing protein n=1 Tax=Syncephalastrum racemosum TaxID=13706 RepID=A0A1X2H4H0_SYNRA|nr:hypothetical protein BCR43DRAFT_371670 [Syncephalastrum racemosum]